MKIRKDQIIKGLQLTLGTVAVMLLFELIFMIPSVEETFLGIMESDQRWLVWLGLWIVMYLQTAIVPIPALSVLAVADKMNLISLNIVKDSLFYLIVMTAYIAGVITAYTIGRKWGKKAVRWVAGSDEDYNKWSDTLNRKGKWFYFFTVLLPIFPDDLLCIVAGAVKFDFKFFLFSNVIGRLIGLVVTVYTLLGIMNVAGSNLVILAYVIILVAALITLIIMKQKEKLNGK